MNIFEELKQHFDLPTMASEYGIDTNKGKTICPACGYKKNPSLAIMQDFYKCHHAGCNFKGDLISFVAAMEKIDMWDAVKLLAKRAGIEFKPSQDEIAKEARSEIYRKFAEKYLALPKAAINYLHDRGLTDDFIERKLIGYVPENAPDEPLLKEQGLPYLMRGRILIPFWHGRQIVYFTGRSVGEPPEGANGARGDPKFKNQKGSKQYIGTMRGPDMIITEGIFDQLLAEQAGQNCIGLAGSAGDIKLYAGIKKVVLVFDNDAAGRTYTEKYAMPLFQQGVDVEIGHLPEGIKDLAELLQAGRGDEIRLEGILDHKIAALREDPKSKTLREEIYLVIGRMDETARKAIFQILKDIFQCDMNDVKREFKQYSSTGKQGFSQGFFDHESVNYKLPYGFTMNEGGIRNSTGITVSRKPLVVTDILHDRVERDNYANIVTWFGDRMISKTFSMKAMSSRSEIVKLKKYNYPIDSENAGDLVIFLREFLYENEGILVEKNASSQLGWHKGDFIFPHMTITKSGDQHPVHYLQDSPSAEDFEKKGDPEKLIQLIRDLKTDLAGDNYVIPMFDIYAMLSSFLLVLLHQGSFVVHHFCESRHGKTLLLKLCAAVIGNPEKLLITWDGTYQFYSRTAAKFKNIPMFINEGSTRLNDQKKEVEKIIYMLAEGKSKGRALQDSGSGTSKIAEFNMVTLSNGEISVLTEQGQTGSEMRVIEFTKTFGEINPIFIAKLEKVINDNFGLDIEGFIKEIMKTNLDDMPLFYTFPHENGEGKSIDAKANFLISRRNQLQPIYVAGVISEKIFNFGYDPKEIVNKVFDEISKNVKLYTGIVDTFIPWLRDWVNQFQKNFPEIVDTLIGDDQKGMPNETYGYIKDQDLCIIPSVFNSCLIKDYNGGDSKAAKGILLELKNKKLIEIESPERNCKTIRVGGMTRRVVYFEDFFDHEKFSNKIKGIVNDPF